MHRLSAQVDNHGHVDHAEQQRCDLSENSLDRCDSEHDVASQKRRSCSVVPQQAREQNVRAERPPLKTSRLLNSQSHGTSVPTSKNPNAQSICPGIIPKKLGLRRALTSHQRPQAADHDENLNPNMHAGFSHHSQKQTKGKQKRTRSMAHVPHGSRQRAGAIAQSRPLTSSKASPIIRGDSRTSAFSAGSAVMQSISSQSPGSNPNSSSSLSVIDQMLANRSPTSVSNQHRASRQNTSAQSLSVKPSSRAHISPAYSHHGQYSHSRAYKHDDTDRAKSLNQKSRSHSTRSSNSKRAPRYLDPTRRPDDIHTQQSDSDVYVFENRSSKSPSGVSRSPRGDMPVEHQSEGHGLTNRATQGYLSGKRMGNGDKHQNDWERCVLVKVLRDQVKSLTEMLSTKDTEFAEKLLNTKERHQNEVRRLRQKNAQVREEYAHRNELFRTMEKGYTENSKQASAQIQRTTCEIKRLKFENQSLRVELRLLKDHPESQGEAISRSERAQYQREIESLKAMIWEERQKKAKDQGHGSHDQRTPPQLSTSTRATTDKARSEDMMKVYQRTLSDLKVTKEYSLKLEAQLKQTKARCEEREKNLREELEAQHRDRLQHLQDEKVVVARVMEALSMENRQLAARIYSPAPTQPHNGENINSTNVAPSDTQQGQVAHIQALQREIDHWKSETLCMKDEVSTSQEEIIHLQNTLELTRSQHPSEDLCSDARPSFSQVSRRPTAASFSDSFLVPLPADQDDRQSVARSTTPLETVTQETQTDHSELRTSHTEIGCTGPLAGVTVIPHRHTELRGVIATVRDLLKLVDQAMKGSFVDFSGSRLSTSGAGMSPGENDFNMSRLSTGSVFVARSPPAQNDSSFDSDTMFDQKHFDEDMDTLRENAAALHTKISDFYASKYESDMQHDGCIVM